MTAISTWKRGDYATVARVVITDDGAPVDLSTGYDIIWQIRRTPNAGSFVTVNVDMSEAGSGVLFGSLEDTVTKEMSPGIWVSDIQITETGGKPFSSKTFEVEVEADVSRAVPEEP
jgi:hypothetical protein